jgi:hypothetical protein
MRQLQPYTIIVPADDGLFVMGFTPEEKSRHDKVLDKVIWTINWEPHDLGWASGREEAYEITKTWRRELVGRYEVRVNR